MMRIKIPPQWNRAWLESWPASAYQFTLLYTLANTKRISLSSIFSSISSTGRLTSIHAAFISLSHTSHIRGLVSFAGIRERYRVAHLRCVSSTLIEGSRAARPNYSWCFVIHCYAWAKLGLCEGPDHNNDNGGSEHAQN